MTGTDAMPALRSLVLDEMPSPHWADVVLEPLPDGAPTDPEVWARAIFDIRSAPGVVVALMALRQLLVPLIGVTPGKQSVFDVQRVSGEEALIRADDRHLDFCAAVGVDPVRRTVRVTTAVRLHGWRGRLYFAPVSVLHDPITRSMMRSAARRLSAPYGEDPV